MSTRREKRKSVPSSVSQRPKRAKIRREAAILADFYAAAWTSIRTHYNEVMQADEDAEEDVRNQGTKATLVTPEDGEIEGASGTANVHAESQAYNAALNKAVAAAGDDGDVLDLFDTYVSGGSIVCDGSKASCFMCAAIAHSLGVEVEHKDLRGFTAYNLPNIFRESRQHFTDLIGATAYGFYEELGGILNGRAAQDRIFTTLGSELYDKHKGSNSNFKLT